MENRFRTQEEVGLAVRELRGDMSQSALGAILGIDQGAVSRIESGQRNLTAKELLRLTDHFGVSSDSVLCHEDELVMLRAGESAPEGVRRSLDEFRECIEDFLGLRALVR